MLEMFMAFRDKRKPNNECKMSTVQRDRYKYQESLSDQDGDLRVG